MDMMKAVADVESVPEIKPRRIPSPRIKDNFSLGNPDPKFSKEKFNFKTKKGGGSGLTKKKKEETQPDIFHVIGNPQKMSNEPMPTADLSKKKKKKKKKEKSLEDLSKKQKKKKGKSKNRYEASSDGSFSVSSYEGDSYLGSLGSLGSLDDSDGFSDSDRSFDSSSSFEGRQKFTMKKRKEEIMQEKIEMLTRISNMSRMGFTATRKWSMKDDIDEIRFECYRMTRENNSRKSVKNMQHMLITAATIVEFANGLVNPFNLKLQGFSKNLMLTVSDYDDSLEELHHKWSGRTSVGPEMTVLFTFVTSAIFHHAGNVMSSPSDQNPSRTTNQNQKKGPDMSSVLGLFSNMMPKSQSPPNKNQTHAPNETPKDPGKKPGRRPMKGPSGAGSNPNLFANLIPSMQLPT